MIFSTTSFFNNIFNLKTNSGIFWDNIEEVRFRAEIYKLREEFFYYVHNDLYKEDKDYAVFDESEEYDAELFDDFYYPIDLYISCENNVFIFTKRELYFFLIILFFLIFNGYLLLAFIYYYFGKNMAYVDMGDDIELEDEPYYFILEKFFNKVFVLLNKRYKKRKKPKDKSLLVIDEEDLFDFILDKNFYYNNIEIFISNNLFPKEWNEKKEKNIKFLRFYYKYLFFYNYKICCNKNFVSTNNNGLKINLINMQKIFYFLFRFKQKNINKIFIKNIIIYDRFNYIIFDNIYYTDYIYYIIISDINILYYFKKFSNKCYLII